MHQHIDLNTALSNRKKNLYASWFNAAINKDPQLAANRLRTPFVPISANSTFSFDDTQAVFTMGSCFARRLENALNKKEINVPMLLGMLKNKDIFSNSTSFNKYNTYSMLYELEWALDKYPYESTQSIVELGENRYSDLQSVSANFNTAPLDEILKRKEKVFELTRKVLDSQVIALTLGLNEVWYDCETERYLNLTPDIKFASKHPKRFELRILGIEENISNLEKIYALLTDLHPGFNMIITVSPVPLLTTFSKHDIIIANMLSKSVLVATAHEFIRRHSNINYFPSYEIAMLSAKERMWEEDLRHISEEGAAFIIDTFLAHYIQPIQKEFL